jgi:hypothetical protein
MLLQGFREPDVARLIEAIAGVSPSHRVAAAIHDATGGNPLFVGELVRLLLTEGRLEEPVDEAGVRLAIPRGVRDVIARRLAQVSEDSREILGVASVLGREFAVDTLVRVTDRSADALVALLDEAIGEGVLAEAPGGAYRMRFSHVLIRDALYDELGAARRMQLHRRIGDTLEELHRGDPDPNLAELAHHFCEAGPGGDPRQAYEYARKAGDRAARLLAYEEAARLYALALRIIEATAAAGDTERGETLIALGNAQLRAGEEGAAKETFLAAARLARQLGAAESLALAALGYGGRYVWGAARGDPHVIPLLEEALATLPAGDGAMRVRLMARLSAAVRDQPFRERRISLSEEAVEMARRVGDTPALAYALDARCIAIDGPDTLEEFGRTAAEVLRLAEEGGELERRLQGHIYLSLFHLVCGDRTAARADIEFETRLAEQSREPAYRWYGRGLYAALALFEGRFAEARELIDQAYAIGRHALTFNATASYHVQTLLLRRECGQGDFDLDAFRAFAAKHPSYTVLTCALAALAIEQGRSEESERLFEELARDDFGHLYVDEEWLAGMTFLSEVCWGLGDTDRAGVLYEQLLPYRELNAVAYPESVLGSIERPLAVLAGMTGRSEAEEHFKRALEANAAMGGRPWVARTQHDYARTLIRRKAADRRRGVQLLAATREVYRDLGMQPWEARVEEELEASR